MRHVIDVTQLVHWSGNLTGIPRVMNELAVRFLEDTTQDAIFVSWVKEVGQMCLVDFDKTRHHRGNGITYAKKSEPVTATTSTDDSAVRSIALKQQVKRVIKKMAAVSRLDRTELFQKMLTTKRDLEVQSYKPYVPEKGDKFFIPWGEWWDQNWLTLIASYTQEKVEVYPVCHDILPMVVPQFSGNSSSLVDFVEQIFPISTKVLAVSESSKRDVAAWMKARNLSVPTITVFRVGEDFSFKKSASDQSILSKKYGVSADEYLLCVGTIEPRKNHAILYYTYKLAHEKGISLPKLLIVGRVGHDVAEIINLIKNDPEVNTSITILNDVNDDDLALLYQNSKFTIMPSFYEGWGMPVLESISRGKPVITSNTSSLLEMPDDCVIRFNPSSTDECLTAIQAMSKPSILKAYRTATKNYKPHTWDDSYRQVIQAIEEK